MAIERVRGVNGKVLCPFCGREATYVVGEVYKDYGGIQVEPGSEYKCWVDELYVYGQYDGISLEPLWEDICVHLNSGEWQVMEDGSVEVVAYSDDEL